MDMLPKLENEAEDNGTVTINGSSESAALIDKMVSEFDEDTANLVDFDPKLTAEHDVCQGEAPVKSTIEDDITDFPLYHTPPVDDGCERESFVTASQESPRRENVCGNSNAVCDTVSSCKTIDLQQCEEPKDTIYSIFEDSNDDDLESGNENSRIPIIINYDKVSLPKTPIEGNSQKSQHVRPVEKTYSIKSKRIRLCTRSEYKNNNAQQETIREIDIIPTPFSKIDSPKNSKNKFNNNDGMTNSRHAPGDESDHCKTSQTPVQTKRKQNKAKECTPQRGDPFSTPKLKGRPRALTPKTPSSTTANRRNQKGETPLHTVCKNGNLNKLNKLLEEDDVDIDVQDNFGWTPLHEACIHKRFECVKLLLEHGAEVNIQSDNNDTPLHDACAKDSADIVKLLLDFGACKTLKNKDGFSPIHYVSSDIVLDHLELATDARNLSMSDDNCPVEDFIENPIIVYSCVSGKEMANLQKICLTFKTERDISKQVTHLVCDVDENMGCRRTIKFLKAMALGVPIVSKLWMEESHKASQWLPTAQYLVLQTPENRKNAPKESYVQHCMGVPGLFTGLSFFVDSTSTKSLVLNRGAVSELIEYAGGKLVKRMPRGGCNKKAMTRVYHASDNSLLHTQPFIIVTESEKLREPHDFIIKNPTWVLNSIADFQLQD